MTKFVSYVPDEAIEKDAQALLARICPCARCPNRGAHRDRRYRQKHLKIGIEFDDTHRLFGVPRRGIAFDPDILGAIFLTKRIVIDESLDPDDDPAKEGRYRYTAAHELGHWRLHRHLGQRFRHDFAARCQRAASVIYRQPGQGAYRIAGRPLCLLRADAAQAGLRRVGRSIPRSQAAGASAVRTDRPSLCRDRALQCRIPGAAFTESDDQALESFGQALRREVPRLANRHAHPGWKGLGCCTARCRFSSFCPIARNPSNFF